LIECIAQRLERDGLLGRLRGLLFCNLLQFDLDRVTLVSFGLRYPLCLLP
jgi:hypothetical protein